MKRPDNLPLPNLSQPVKIRYTLLLLLALVLYAGTWFQVLQSVYWSVSPQESPRLFGIGLAMLAQHDSPTFWAIFSAHALSIGLMLAASFSLFNKTSLRRRVKKLLAIAAGTLALLDISGWLYAPSCTETNLYVGIVSAFTALPLAFLSLAPLYQMWIYKRWKNPDGNIKRVVIVGGGFAGLYAALGLNSKLGYNRQLEITVIDSKNYFLFPPLLPSAAAGTIETRQVSYPFRRIFETTNIIFRKAFVSSINPDAKTVNAIVEINSDPETNAPISRHVEFEYNLLVLAPGSVTQTFGIKGAAEHAFFMRELNDAVVLRNHVIDCFERAAVLDDKAAQSELLRFVVVGAGPTGIETATEIYDLIHHVLLKRYPEINPQIPEVIILQSGKRILPGWHDDIVKTAAKQLTSLAVKVRYGARVSEIGARFVAVGEEKLATRTVIWCAGVKPSELLKNSGLPLHESGRVLVEPDLRAKEHDNVFVLGDAAYLLDERSGKALPPLGQVAFQQGSHTAKNLVRQLSSLPTVPFRYFDFGGLVSVGEHFAAVNLMGVRLSGFIGWIIWRSLYLVKLVGVSNKIRVMIDWSLDLLIERSISQIRDSRQLKLGRETSQETRPADLTVLACSNSPSFLLRSDPHLHH